METHGLFDGGEVNVKELSGPAAWQLLELGNGWSAFIFLATSTILHLVDHVSSHSRPPESFLHERKGAMLALVSCLSVAPIQCNAPVGHNKTPQIFTCFGEVGFVV